MTVTVDIQWALYGRAPDSSGPRVLSCSTGELNRDNFGEVISRFSLGTPDTLPQVTVSYAASGGNDGNYYLAVAIHQYADADWGLRADETGRPVVYTRYFCAPYLPLSSAAIGYLPLYRAVRALKLPMDGKGPPRRIAVPETVAGNASRETGASPESGASPEIAALAKQVAALLATTGRPACVIGANSASLTERLQFLDMVMTQLPYGNRTRMTAATWVRPTHRDHRFRLYFSDAPRDHSPPDHSVWWGRPDQSPLTPADGTAFAYQRFLEAEDQQPATRLSGLTSPVGFKVEDVQALLAGLGIQQPRPEEAAQPEQKAQQTQPAQPTRPGRATPGEGHDSAEAVLEQCARHAKAPELTQLAADIGRLQRIAASGESTGAQRARYRALITTHDLLRPNTELAQQEGKLYDALLALAFGQRLRYKAYCQVEDCLGNQPGTPVHRSLLHAIRRAGLGDAPVAAIVLTKLGAEQQLSNQFKSALFDAVQLIDLLGGEWPRPEHFRIVCDVTLDYLASAGNRDNRTAVRRALRRQGFLAHALQAAGRRDQKQVTMLRRLLSAVYPGDEFDREAIGNVLLPGRTTPALFAAVLTLARREDVATARDAYAMASLSGLDLDADTKSELEQLLPAGDPAGGDSVKFQWGQPSRPRRATAPRRSATGSETTRPGS